MMTKNQGKTAPASSGWGTDLSQKLVQRIIGLPRLVRIILVAVLALAVTLALSPMIDDVYFRLAFDPLYAAAPTVARILPSLITASVGLAMYAVGWWLVIGTVGETPQHRIAVLWYVGLGLLALIVVVILVIRGVTLLNLLME